MSLIYKGQNLFIDNTSIKSVVKKKDALPFRIPKGINLVIVDVETGLQPNNETKKMIYESFKPEDKFIAGLEKSFNKDRLNFYDSENKKKVLRFSILSLNILLNIYINISNYI